MAKRFLSQLTHMVVAGAFFMSSTIMPAYADIEMSKVDRDVGKSVMNARLAMRDLAECNLPMLAKIDATLAREQNNLMMLQGWVFNQLRLMGEQLHNIFSDMEDLMQKPSGNEKVVFETLKSGLTAAGLVPGFGAIAYGASLTIQAGEIYAQWHNSSQAADIADGIKENAREQVEAFEGAVSIYNDIVAGLKEIEGYRARVQQLMDTYEERCLKKKPGDEDYGLNISPAGATPTQVEDAVLDGMNDIDECDLAQLIALNKFLTAQIDNLFKQQQAVFEDLLSKSGELNSAMSELEKGLPQAPDLGWEGVKAVIGSGGLGGTALSVGSAATSVGTQIVDMQGSLDGLRASESLKGPVRDKMQELLDIVKKNEEILNVLKRLRDKQKHVQNLIETWEERCADEEDNTVGAIPDGSGILIGTDGSTWCTYGFGSPTVVPVNPDSNGPAVTPVDDDDIFAPPPNIPAGTTPGGTNTPPTITPGTPAGTPINTPSGHTKTGAPSGGDSGRPSSFIPIGPSGGSTPSSSKPTDDGPSLTVKARQSVLDAGTSGQKAVAGQQIKLFADATVGQKLPGTRGAKKNDADYNKDPLQCTTGRDGTCKINVPANTFAKGPKSFEVNVDVTKQASLNAQVSSANAIPKQYKKYITGSQKVNGKQYVTLTYPASMDRQIKNSLNSTSGVNHVETNYCRDKQPGPQEFFYLYGEYDVPAQTIIMKEAR